MKALNIVIAMRQWFTAFILVTALLGGAVGLGAHEGEGSCPMTNMPDCCKKAQSAGNTPAVSMARLCCNLNCSEPGSSGSNASSFSPQPSVAPNVMLMPQAMSLNGIALTHYRQNPHKQDSNPKYIQHLALLI
jgi:hypothetical protein